MTNANDLINPAWINNGPDDRGYTNYGLIKREYFAAMAMQGLLASSPKAEDGSAEHIYITIRRAVLAADELIEQLNKDTKL